MNLAFKPKKLIILLPVIVDDLCKTVFNSIEWLLVAVQWTLTASTNNTIVLRQSTIDDPIHAELN